MRHSQHGRKSRSKRSSRASDDSPSEKASSSSKRHSSKRKEGRISSDEAGEIPADLAAMAVGGSGDGSGGRYFTTKSGGKQGAAPAPADEAPHDEETLEAMFRSQRSSRATLGFNVSSPRF